jgi:hypothetical protein
MSFCLKWYPGETLFYLPTSKKRRELRYYSVVFENNEIESLQMMATDFRKFMNDGN